MYIYTLGAFAPGAVPGEWRVAWTGAYALITALALDVRQTDAQTPNRCFTLSAVDALA